MPLALIVLLTVLASPGESIYRSGAAPDGEITATITGGEVRVAATMVPCASCHGADGRGGTEGGLISPDIRWSTLTKPYAVIAANGRRRGPYSRRLLKRAITIGVDANGNALSPVMPRFQMSGKQIESLMTYLEALDGATSPGVNDSTVRVGVVLPPAEPLPALRAAFRSVIAAYFEEISRSGGVFGRRIEPVFTEGKGNADERASALRNFVRANDVLALAPAFTDGAEEAMAKVADEERVPLLASMTSRPASSVESHAWARDLYAGVDEQARLLAWFAARRLEAKGPVAVIADSESRAAQSAIAELDALGVAATRVSSWPDSVPIAIFLGDESMLHGALRPAATLLAPGAVTPPSLLRGVPQGTRVFISLPTTMEDLTPEGLAVWKKVAPPASPYRGNELAALAAATLFVHALERAGRDLTRQSFMNALDAVQRLRTGFSPPLTFGPNRRIGSLGAWIVEATAKEPAAIWIDPFEN